MYQGIYKVKENTALTDCVYKMVLEGDTTALTAPGQFINITVEGCYLKRPILVFDWDDENGQDGIPDHVGIVEKVENGRIYTIEGNSDDACKQKVYSEGCYEILGYVSPK